MENKRGSLSITSENKKLFDSMKAEYSKTYQCVSHIQTYLKDHLEWNPSEEELLYLMLHINRLCSREDCNR